MNPSLLPQSNTPLPEVPTSQVGSVQKFHLNFRLIIISLSVLAVIAVAILVIIFVNRSRQPVVITDPQKLTENYVNESLRPEYRQSFVMTPSQNLDYRLATEWKIEKSWFIVDFHQFKVNNVFEPRLIFLSVVQSGHPDLDKYVATELIDKYLLSSPEMKETPFKIYRSSLNIPVYEKVIQNPDQTLEARVVTYYDSSTRSAILIQACRLFPETVYYISQRCFGEKKL